MTGNFPVGGPVPPSYGPVYPPPPKPSRAGVWLGSIACVLAAAALVVGVVALVTAQREPAPVPPPEEPTIAAEKLLIPEVDKAFCREIGPLIREQTDRTNALIDVGPADSPERRAAIPKFQADSVRWYDRIQPIVNRHSEPPRYLARTVQDFVDGMLLYSENLHDDRGPDPFDDEAYDSAIVYVGGPLSACYKLGAGW